ncbi:hypothetical protein J2X76_003664 [Neorhizobium sp. 2083]|uniref:hypothetical protein n=1 Tax=Neorhizobium sp. 2083 TaxID=2817762 RepID=UPI002866777B|nr:hypothetical protein [Neorhizobium sp. 2083]MDR6818487.1 hypothetical protein [Neorhizobium sp. 2083]
MSHDEAEAIFAEFSIEIVPKNVMPQIGQTRAVGTLQRIIRRYGAAHARLVVMALADASNNQAAVNETGLWATSDIILAFNRNYPSIMENDMSRFLEFYDGVPIGILQFWLHGLDGITNKRAALVGLLWERAYRVFGAPQMEMFDGRAA